MSGVNLPILFGAILGGGVLIDKGIKSTRGALETPTGTGSTGTGAAAGGGGVASVKGVPVLPYGTPLAGAGAQKWASAILHSLGAPATNVNIMSLATWFGREGGGGQNNPLNTTLQLSGSTPLSGNSAGVQQYGTPSEGVAATVQTLAGYPGIVAALKSGVGLFSPSLSSEFLTWSGGGYSTP